MTRLILDNCSVPETLIDKQNYDRRTPLHVAVLLHSLSEDNKIDLVKYLIDRGASKTVRDKDKHTPQSLVQPSQIKVSIIYSKSMNITYTYLVPNMCLGIATHPNTFCFRLKATLFKF